MDSQYFERFECKLLKPMEYLNMHMEFFHHYSSFVNGIYDYAAHSYSGDWYVVYFDTGSRFYFITRKVKGVELLNDLEQCYKNLLKKEKEQLELVWLIDQIRISDLCADIHTVILSSYIGLLSKNK